MGIERLNRIITNFNDSTFNWEVLRDSWDDIEGGAEGPPGPEGPEGPQGPEGDPGAVEVYEQTGTPTEPIDVGAVWIDTDEPTPTRGVIQTTGASFPSSPVDDDMHAYFNGQGFWQFVFNGAWWYYVGGPSLIGIDPDSRSRTNTAYGAPPTDPITVTIPLDGDYDIEYEVTGLGVTGLNSNQYSYSVGGTAASDTWAAVMGFTASFNTVSSVYRHTGVTASDAITEAWRSTSGTATAQQRRLRVTPVRIQA